MCFRAAELLRRSDIVSFLLVFRLWAALLLLQSFKEFVERRRGGSSLKIHPRKDSCCAIASTLNKVISIRKGVTLLITRLVTT